MQISISDLDLRMDCLNALYFSLNRKKTFLVLALLFLVNFALSMYETLYWNGMTAPLSYMHSNEFKSSLEYISSFTLLFIVYFESALERKKRATPPHDKIIDGRAEAQLLRIACGKAPGGRASWTLELLADKMVELKIVDTVSRETVRRTLKKTNSNPTCANAG